MLPLALFSIALVMALYAIQNKKGKKTQVFIVETLLGYMLPLSVGVMGIVSFFCHTFFSDETAKMIGWASGSPFQFEVASANLAIGIAGLLCLFFKRGFWLATSLISSIYLLFDSIGYIEYFDKNYHTFGHWGFFLFFEDFFIPLLLLTLSLLYMRQIYRQK